MFQISGLKMPGERFMDPRMKLAQALIDGSVQRRPDTHWMQGLGRMSKMLTGSYLQGQVARDQNQDQQALFNALYKSPLGAPTGTTGQELTAQAVPPAVDKSAQFLDPNDPMTPKIKAEMGQEVERFYASNPDMDYRRKVEASPKPVSGGQEHYLDDVEPDAFSEPAYGPDELDRRYQVIGQMAANGNRAAMTIFPAIQHQWQARQTAREKTATEMRLKYAYDEHKRSADYEDWEQKEQWKLDHAPAKDRKGNWIGDRQYLPDVNGINRYVDTGEQVFKDVTKSEKAPAPSALSKLYSEMESFPVGDPRRAIWKNKIDKATSHQPATIVNNNQEKGEGRKFGEGLAGEHIAAREAATSAHTIKIKNRALRGVDFDTRPGSSWTVSAGGLLRSLFPGMTPESLNKYLANAEMFQSITMNGLLEKLATQKGPQTEGDAERALKTLASINNEKSANEFILDFSDAVADSQIALARFMNKFKKEHGTVYGWQEAWFNSPEGQKSIYGYKSMEKWKPSKGSKKFKVLRRME